MVFLQNPGIMKTKTLLKIILLLMYSSISYSQSTWEELYSEDFESGYAEDWNLDPGWMVNQVNDNYVLMGENHYWANCTIGKDWFDYSFRSKLNIQQGAIHINFRLSDRGRYLVGISQEGISLTRHDLWETFTDLGYSELSIAEGVWHSIEIIANQKAIQIFVDQQLQLQVWDDNALMSGTFAFETLENSKFYVDSIMIQGPPQTDPPAGYDWFKTGGPPGGLGYDIRIHPEDPQIVFVTDNPSGVNKSFDGGKLWHQRNEGITVRTGDSNEAIPVFSLTIDPRNPDRVWCGTQNSKGIFRSEDCGENWTRKDQGITEGDEISFRGFAIHPANSDIVLGAAEIATVEQGVQFNKTKGKIYKTVDGGENWYQVWEGDNLARVLLFDYQNPDTLYCSTGIFDREAYDSDGETNSPGGVGILRSVDGGESWTPINNGIDNLYTGFLEMHPKNPGIIYTAAGNHSYNEGIGGVYKTIDCGENWVKVIDKEGFSAVTISGSNPDIVYAFNEGACYRSDDGGDNWTKYQREGEGIWGPPGIKPGIPISAAVDSLDHNKVFVNNYNGGNFLSTDGGKNWVNSSNGYTGADIRDIQLNPVKPSEVYCVGRNGAFKSLNGGREWWGITNGEAGTEILSLGTVEKDLSAMYSVIDGESKIIKSNDWGDSWSKVFQFDASSIKSSGFHRFSTVAVSQSNPQVIYAGMDHVLNVGNLEPDGLPSFGLYKSTDGGTNWSEFNTGLDSSSRIINTIAIHPDSPDIVYAGTFNDGIYKTVDGGLHWNSVNNGLGSSDIRSIAIDPDHPDVIYAGSGNGFGIYKTENSGELWVECNNGIYVKCPSYLSSHGKVVEGMDLDRRNPLLQSQDYNNITWTKVLDIVIDPANTKNVFATDFGFGIYYSQDAGSTWAKINSGLTLKTPTCLTISQDGTVLYAGTSGGGVFRLVLGNKSPVVQHTIPNRTDTVTIFQGDSLDFEVISFDLNNDTLMFSWALEGDEIAQTTEPVFNLNTTDLNLGVYDLHVTVSDNDTSVSTSWIVEVKEFPTGVFEKSGEEVQGKLIDIYPNPFNESIRIDYLLLNDAQVSIDIYDISGKRINSLFRGYQGSGRHSLSWNGKDQRHSNIPAGIYICRFVFQSNHERFVREHKIVYTQ